VLQLFSAATVEERILANAAKKRKLEAVVCAHMGRGAGAELSPAELRACLTHGRWSVSSSTTHVLMGQCTCYTRHENCAAP
jgi:hypothetical protein